MMPRQLWMLLSNLKTTLALLAWMLTMMTLGVTVLLSGITASQQSRSGVGQDELIAIN